MYKPKSKLMLITSVVALTLALLVSVAQPASAGPKNGKLTRLTSLGVGTFTTYGALRSTDGMLHLIYQTTKPGSAAPDGLVTRSISPSGAVGPEVTALTGWGTSVPGLVQLPGGTLEAVFGAVSPKNVSDIWGITSSDEGAHWAAPAQVGSGAQDEVQAYGAAVTGVRSGPTPVWTLSVGGGLVVQQGFGLSSPTTSLLSGADHFASDVDSALDAGSHQVVVSWNSAAHNGGDFMETAAPKTGTRQAVPGQVKNEVVIAGRDSGPGVFAAYTTDGSHVRLLRYGGGTEAVGSVPGVTPKALGVATGVDGRIWVIWGDEGALAVTRSNKSVTKCEPIQQLDPNALTLYRVGGDGRLGPLDLLVQMIPGGDTNVPGTFYTRVLPELSGSTTATSIKNKSGIVIGSKLTVHVSDAGDAVTGAIVAAAGKQQKTNSLGSATFVLPASVSGLVKIKVSAPTYQVLETTITI